MLGGNFMKSKVDEIKADIAKSLLEIEDEGLLIQVKDILDCSKTEGWQTLSDTQKNYIIEARQELAQGEGIVHEDVKAEYSKWLSK